MDLSKISKKLIKFIENLYFMNCHGSYKINNILYDFFSENYNDISKNITFTKKIIELNDKINILDKLRKNKNIPINFRNILEKHRINKIKKNELIEWFDNNRYSIIHKIEDNYNCSKLSGLINNFISMEILLEVDKLNKSTKFVYNYENNNLILEFISDNDISETMTKRLATKAFLLMKIKNLENVKLKTKIWMTNSKKTLKNKYNKLEIKLGIREVNSGCSKFKKLNDTGKIFIWRTEELEKVFVHELIHSLNMSFLVYPKKFTEDFHKMYHVPKNNSIFVCETYVEIWACIINCILVSYLHKNKNFNELLEKEIKFSMFQFSKILLFFGFDCLDKCNNSFKKKIDDLKINGNFNQKTSVFSYYFIKSALLFNLEKFIKFCLGNENLIQFNKNNFKKFHDLIVLSLNNENFIKNINTTINKIKILKKNNEKQDIFQLSTLRMTLSELNF